MTRSATLIYNRVRFTLTNRPHVAIGVVLVLVITALVVVPFLQMVYDTAVWQEADRRLTRAARPGEWTFFHYKRVFSSPLSLNVFYRPLLHSLETSLAISVFAIAIGALIAWLVVRTDMPGRKVISI